MNRIAPIAAMLALACALTGSPSEAQRAEWDQDEVTELAVELSDVVADLQREFRRQPRPDIGSMQSRARFQFGDDLRVLRTETRALASQLESGAGFEETLPIARRSRRIIRDLRAEARRMKMVQPALGYAERAEEIVARIAPFYFDPDAS
jgi:hypothetical protein